MVLARRFELGDGESRDRSPKPTRLDRRGDPGATADAHAVGSAGARLLAMTPALKRFGTLFRDLEARYRIFFPRHHAAIRSDLQGGEPMIRAWISSL